MKVTIGIPAYNEEKNIATLLKALNSQVNIDITEIIIVDDASSDNTLAEINSVGNSNVTVMSNRSRMGKNTGLNIIFRHAKTDILILMDADIKLLNNSTLSLACDEVIKNTLSLAALKIEPVEQPSLISKIVGFGQYLKNNYYEITQVQNNIHTCVGRTLILSRNFYSSLTIPQEITGDDAFLYLTCKVRGLNYSYLDSQSIGYKSPTTLADFLKQNVRYVHSKKQLDHYFDKPMLDQEFDISFIEKARVSFKGFYEDTFMYLLYATFYLGAKILALLRKDRISEKWSPATTTK